MDKQNTQDNQDQIIRKDARSCFVEVKSDCFHLDKDHLQFVTYDQKRPVGQRYTNNIHIYINVPEFPDRPPFRDKAERSAEADLWDYAKSDPKHLSMLSHVSHEILNVLEDGYIEQRMISEYPGVLGSCLLARQPRSFDLLPTVTQMAEAEDNGGHIGLLGQFGQTCPKSKRKSV